MKTNIGKATLLLLLLTTAIAPRLTAQSSVNEFNSLIEKNIVKNRQHKEKGLYSVSISKDESRMTIYWDLLDLSDRTDFDLLYKRDTVINSRKYIVYSGMSCAFKNYGIAVFYPIVSSNNISELQVLDKRTNMLYCFHQ